MLTDSKIKAAIKSFALSPQKSLELVADGRRGSGRVVLVLKQYNAKAKGGDASKKFAVEWYARFHTLGGKRKVVKIGNYPEMSLAQAVQIYGEEYAPKIARGEEAPKGIKELRREAKVKPTVGKLFEAYHAHLVKREAPAAANAKCCLDVALKTIDPDKPANEVTVDEIKSVLRAEFRRGVRSQAANIRAWLSAAFGFGMKSANSYTSEEDETDFEITVNPVTAIPRDTEASKPGKRHLAVVELVDFWLWCDTQAAVDRIARAAQLLMATGQRPGEILCLGNADAETRGHYLPDEELLTWGKTKNDMPHCIPLPATAKRIMKDQFCHPNGLYFPKHHRRVHHLPTTSTEVSDLIKVYLEKRPAVPYFTARDLRRTWKTLAGQAGLSKEIRDRLQNHAMDDVSSKHYDRYEYMDEKREAMRKWDAFLAAALLKGAQASPAEKAA